MLQHTYVLQSRELIITTYIRITVQGTINVVMIGPAEPLKYLDQYLITVPPTIYGVLLINMMVHIVCACVCACARKHIFTHIVER